ncbi:DoxX family protein [Pontibacter pamirensis]|uniref:DoxX family protein n=1 Tax=Pontibacter pamirensis TaxID=2562824 RepID=UPI0013894339|nr:hypothetical protein [Pontibacter pamirensis]
MIPLFVLLGAFAISSSVIRYTTNRFNFPLAGRIALSIMLLFTATGHFAYPEGMALMIPDFIPFKKEAVFLTGLFEIAAAVGLQIGRLQAMTAWLLIAFFILVLPANIHAAIRNIDYQTGANTGPGLAYLWFRVPLQVFFIVWTYFFGVRLNNAAKSPRKRMPINGMGISK